MIKNMSKADVEFIKRSLRFTKKNKELNDKDTNRMKAERLRLRLTRLM